MERCRIGQQWTLAGMDEKEVRFMEYKQSRWQMNGKVEPHKGSYKWPCSGGQGGGLWYMTDGPVAICGSLYGLVVKSEGNALFFQKVKKTMALRNCT